MVHVNVPTASTFFSYLRERIATPGIPSSHALILVLKLIMKNHDKITSE